MDLKELVTKAIEIETLTGGAFFKLHQKFGDDPEASRVFSKLAVEESEHADVLKRQLALIQTKPEAYTEVDPAMEQRQHMLLAQLQTLSRRIETESLTLDEALQACLQIEEGDDKMIEDLRQSLGKMSFEAMAVEVLALQKHPDHNAEFVGMLRRRGIVRATPTVSDSSAGDQ
ncbi:MAG: hypothetical protein CMH81_02055 [Nitrospiraceae bacterium]|nr:hypothetical protein [Nitrospiraceae bacterium]|tara:strand:+ start:1028 stop:1546 length:519 start_codon:yes stop_codon:yes gene_type:complete